MRSPLRPTTLGVHLYCGNASDKGERVRHMGRPFSFLLLDNGVGGAWKGEQEGFQIDEGEEERYKYGFLDLLKRLEEESPETETIELEDRRKLGIATLGALKQHPRISAFRRFIEGWYLSYFTPDAARGLPLAGPQKHLNVHGDNLGNVVQFMEREHPRRFQAILASIAKKIPGIDKIDTKETDDGRLLLRFIEKGYQHHFYAQQISDGTLKAFAYLLLLEDPTPPPFLCIGRTGKRSLPQAIGNPWPLNSANMPVDPKAALRFL